MNFIENLRKAKNDKKMKTSELATLSGVPLGTLNKLFSGAIEEPKLSVALSLAAAMSMSLDELCGHSAISECLTREEQTLVDAYRRADTYAKETLLVLAEREADRPQEARASATLLPLPDAADEGKVVLPLFLLPVSAGRGAILDSDASDEIEIRSTRISNAADFAVRVSGDSMEPRFKSGDVLLVRRQSTLDEGELGIFIGDGEGYFKRFEKGALHSINERYDDIPLSSFSEFSCVGKVIGRVHAN